MATNQQSIQRKNSEKGEWYLENLQTRIKNLDPDEANYQKTRVFWQLLRQT